MKIQKNSLPRIFLLLAKFFIAYLFTDFNSLLEGRT